MHALIIILLLLSIPHSTHSADISDVVVKTADYASMQSDRWLFVSTLLIGLICFGWLVRYFVTQIKVIQERSDKQIQLANQKADQAYQDFNSHLQAANSKLTDALIRHSEALESNTDVIKRFLNKP